MNIGIVIGLIKALAPGVDPEIIEQAVMDWLDDHPEATTTVQDGSITEAKLAQDVLAELGEIEELKEAIAQKAPAIIVDSEEGYSHSGIAGASKITFKGNSLAFDTAQYADKVNYAPLLDASETYKNVEFTGTDGFIVANGTASGSGQKLMGYVDFATYLPVGNYKIIARVDAGESVLDPQNNAQYQVRFVYDDGTTLEKNTYIGATDKTWDATTTKPTKRIAIYAGIINGVVYASYKTWWGVYDASVTIIDTQQTVSASGSYDLNLSSNNLTAIDTMQHKSVVESMADTKAYIDEKEVNIDEELTYVTPERFGAKGDGTTNDYTALVSCLSYAITNNIPVRALGVYRISTGLTVVCDEMDIFINKLITSATFTGAMFKLTGQKNKVTINNIDGSSGDCAGFHLYGVVGHGSNCNTIHIPCISVKQNALIVNAENGASCFENEFHTRYIRSASGDCLHLEDGYGENVYFGGGQIVCANGWAIYTESCSDHFYNFALENTSKYGIYISGYCNTFYGFRIAELRAQRNPENEDGVLIKFVNGARFNIFECGDIINYIDVDVTDASANEDLDATTVRMEGYGINIVRGAGVRPSHADGDVVGFMTTCGREIITLRNQKIMTPFGRMRRTVNGNLDYTTFYGQVYATDYVIKADATIKFNSCFCPVGFNDIVIDQTDGHYATIYDKANNVIFDGSSYGTGVFRLSCVCDMDDNVARDLATSQSSVLASALMYDGTNETWSVTTISGS